LNQKPKNNGQNLVPCAEQLILILPETDKPTAGMTTKVKIPGADVPLYILLMSLLANKRSFINARTLFSSIT